MSAVSGKNTGGQVPPPGTGGNAGPERGPELFAAKQQIPPKAEGQPSGNTQQPNLLEKVFAGGGRWSGLARTTVSREGETTQGDQAFGQTLQSCPGTVSQETGLATNQPVAGFPVPTDEDD